MGNLTINTITAALLLLSISVSTRGKLEADNVSYIPEEGQETESDIRSETAVPHRMLAAFKTCAQCKCCPGPGGTNCSMMRCCYSLFCQPNGKCSFRPFACNCNSCS